MDFAGVSADWVAGPAGARHISGPDGTLGSTAGFHYRDAADGDSGAGDQGNQRSPTTSWCCLKIVAIIVFVIFSARVHSPGELAPVCAERMGGDADGRSYHFLHLYRIRLGLDREPRSAGIRRGTCPSGIIASLVVCTVLYIAVAGRADGIVPWQSMVGDAAPVVECAEEVVVSAGRGAAALGAPGGAYGGAGGDDFVAAGVPAGAGAGVVCDVARPAFAAYFRPSASALSYPDFSTWLAGFVVGVPTGLLDIGTLADLSNIGTLFAFALVAGGVLILRYREPDRYRAFRAPGGPLAPVLTILTCLLLMAGLPIMNWIRFFLWLIIGLVIYYFYGRRKSTLRLAAQSKLRSAKDTIHAPARFGEDKPQRKGGADSCIAQSFSASLAVSLGNE